MDYTENLATLNADGGDKVRLLRILHLPRTDSESLKCEVRVFSLQEAPRYAALSYSWHLDGKTSPVRFKGSLQSTKAVSKDIQSALKVFHRNRPAPWLWVDAICIDQSQVDEKNDQVPRMQAIYQDAHVVIIWLGSAVHDKQTNFANYGPDFARHARLGLTGAKVMQLLRLAQVGRAWWCRVWVIQEMVVATRLTVYIGSHAMSWERFVRATSDFSRFDFAQESQLMAQTSKIQRLDGLRERWREHDLNIDALELLGIGRTSHATDAKDNVYALLGLMHARNRQLTRVDYNLTVSQVYSEMTIALIARTHSLDFIVGSFWHQNSRSQPSLPSWVPDYGSGEYSFASPTGHTTTGPSDCIKTYQYSSGADTRPWTRYDTKSSQLSLQVVFFDEVVATTAREDLFSDYKTEYARIISSKGRRAAWKWIPSWLRSVAALFETSIHMNIPSVDPRSSLARCKDLARILTNVHVPRRNTSALETYRMPLTDKILLEVAEHAFDESDCDRLGKKYLWLEDHLMGGSECVFFATTRGFVGWAGHDLRERSEVDCPSKTHSACPGDIIVVPNGASMPWVLRETDVKGEYRLIVDCLVDGIMHGELMGLVDAKKMQTEWITLV